MKQLISRSTAALGMLASLTTGALLSAACTSENAPSGPGGNGSAGQGPAGGATASGGMAGAGGLASGGAAGSGGSAAGGGVGGGGGTSGSGGSGGTGEVTCTPVVSRCDCVSKADGINRWIDGFEDGDAFINSVDNRNGEWFQAKALTNAVALGTMSVESTTAGAPGTTQALHVTGGPTGDAKDWPTFGVPLGYCYDASPFTGISFWIKGSPGAGNDTIRFSIATPPTTAKSAGGTCADTDVGCYDHFGADVIIPETWQEKKFTWSQLPQKGWGTAAPGGYAKEREILAINFAPFLNTEGYDFWIDDVQFMTDSTASCADVISEEMFNSFFPSRNSLYTYAGFAEAARQWPSFCTEGDDSAKKRDVAALFAHFVQETGNQTGPTGGLVHIEEIGGAGKDYCDEARTDFACVGGQGYHGRGPMQLSWNYNYGSAGRALGLSFLESPGLVTQSGANAFNAALWFWMTRQPLKSAHTQIVTGEGFGATIRTVNGPLECDGKNAAAVDNRISAYLYFCKELGVDPGGDQGC